MTRRKEAAGLVQRVPGPPKMAPPPPSSQATKRESAAARSSLAATKLVRFARTPPSQGTSPVSSQASSPASAEELSAPLPSMEQHTLQYSLEDTAVSEVCASSLLSPASPTGTEDAGPEPTIKDIFAAISSCNANLMTLNIHMGDLKSDMAHVRRDLQAMSDRVKAAEDRVSNVEDQLPPLAKAMKSATHQITTLLAKVDDLENRSRRSNIRIVGVPEREEGRDPVAFFENWLMDIMGKNILSPFFAIERAHRVPTRSPPPGAPPRPILMKLLHFRDRDAILRAARDKGEISIHGHRVSFYPDFSNDVQKKRMQFLDIKKRLRGLGVSYSMLYPAKLRVAALDATHFFDSPKDALTWLDSNERSLRRKEHPG